jgi:hypothetical protein
LAHVCADLWPPEAIEQLGRAYEDGLVDTGSIDWQDIEHALALGQQGAMKWARYRDPLITDVAKNMGWMQCFQKAERHYEGEGDAEEDLLESPAAGYTTAPIHRTAPKVGRNEPCPCGSVNGERSITGDTALRLAHFFGTTAEFWLNLQSLYELRLAQQKAGKSIRALPTLKDYEPVHA